MSSDSHQEPLDEQVEREWRKASREWPGLDVPLAAFREWVAERIPSPAGDGTEALTSIRCDALFLCCGCARGDTEAMGILEERHFRQVDTALARLGLSRSEMEDVKQELRQLLFIGDEGRAPRIAGYSGRGGLDRWLWVIATRHAVRRQKRQKREAPIDPGNLAELAGELDPELAHLKGLYSRQFKEAFAQAISSLDPADRNLLRYHYLDRISIDEIGALLGAHRATAARRLQKIRNVLSEETRRHLSRETGAEGAQLESIMRLVRSQLELSISRHLRDDGES